MNKNCCRIYLLLFVFTIFSVVCTNTFAQEKNVSAPQLLNSSAGMADNPQNIRISLELNKTLRSLELKPDNINVWIYPSGYSDKPLKTEAYRSSGVMVWRAGELLFLDVRKPPYQKSGGKFHVLVEIASNGKTLYSQTCESLVHYEASRANVALVIDCSHSMSSNDKPRNRIAAAKAFIETAARDGRTGSVCIISFNDMARELCPPVALDALGKERLLRALSKIGSSGQTNIGFSLQQALRSLQKVPGGRNAVVLLTDGKNESVAYGDEHLELAVRNIPVYSIGLCEEVDTRLLDKISSETGGKSYHAATSRELMATYQQIAADILRSKVIISERVKKRADFTVPVDSSIKELNFLLDAGVSQAKIILQSPSGDSSVLDYSGEDYQQLRVPNPQSGLWLVKVENSSSSLPVTLSITARTDFFLDIFPPVRVGDHLCFAATLANGGKPVTGMQACMVPGFGEKPVKLFDDGAHFDGEAGDGVYAARIAVPAKAQLLARAWGVDGEEFLRQADSGLLASREVVEVKAPLLVCNGEVDFGACVAGGVLSSRLDLTAQDIRGDFSLSWKLPRKEQQPVIIHSGLQKSGYKLSSKLTLKAPQEFAVGDYVLQGTAHIGEMHCPVRAKFRIIPPKVKFTLDKVSLGTLRPGQRLKTRIRIRTNSLTALPVSFKSKTKWLGVHADKSELAADSSSMIVDFNLRPGAPEGTFEKLVSVKVGPQSYEFSVKLHVSGKSKSLSDNLPVHEFVFVPPGLPAKDRMPIHEFSFQTSEPDVVAALPDSIESPDEFADSQNDLSKDNVQTTNVSQTPPLVQQKPDAIASEAVAGETQGGYFSPYLRLWWLLLLSLLVAGLLLLVRALLHNRMLRFGLLSLALHLPLVAFFVGYLLVSGQQPALDKVKPEQPVELIAELEPTVIESSELSQSKSMDLVSAINRETVAEDGVDVLAGMSAAKNGGGTLHRQRSAKFVDAPELVSSSKTQQMFARSAARRKSGGVARRDVLKVKRFGDNVPQVALDAEVEHVVVNSSQHVPGVKAERGYSSRLPVVVRQMNVGQTATLSEKILEPKVVTDALSVDDDEAVALRPLASVVKREPAEKIERSAPVDSVVVVGKKSQPFVRTVKIKVPDVTATHQLRESPDASMLAEKRVVAQPQILASTKSGRHVAKRAETSVRMSQAMEALPEYKTKQISGGVGSVAPEPLSLQAKSVLENRKPSIQELEIPEFAEDVVVDTQSAFFVEKRVALEREPRPIIAQKKKQSAAVEEAKGDVSFGDNLHAEAAAGMPHIADSISQHNRMKDQRVRIARVQSAPQSTVQPLAIATDAQPLKKSATVHQAEKTLLLKPEQELMALAPARENGIKQNASRINLPYNPVQLERRRDGQFALNRPAPEQAVSGSVLCSASVEGVGVSVGFYGVSPQVMDGLGSTDSRLKKEVISLEAKALQRQQLVVVRSSQPLSQQEIKKLGQYVNAGGNVWFAGDVRLGEKAGLSKMADGAVFSVIDKTSGMAVYGDAEHNGRMLCTVAGDDPEFSQLAQRVLAGFLPQLRDADQIVSNDGGHVIHDFSGGQKLPEGWRLEKWSAKSSVGIVPDGGGGHALLLKVSGQKKGASKSCVSHTYAPQRLSLAGAKKYMIDVYNPSGVSATIEVLFTCYDQSRGWGEFYTMPVRLRPGWNRKVAFDLQKLKERGGSRYESSLAGADQCARVGCLLRMEQPGVFLLDNICWQ